MVGHHDRKQNYAALLLLVLTTLACWRLGTAWLQGLELFADEAQYWTWSLTPDWGYYSKPPMVAWLITLGTTLFGDSELGVRAATFVIWPSTAWVIFLIVRRLYRDQDNGEATAFWSAIAFASLPMVSLGSWLITTDGPLLLFWALTLYFLLGALESDSWKSWLATGAAAGLGLMSKYSMVFFAPALLIYLVLSPAKRHLLLSPKLYAAAGIALAILTPNLLWNANHEFVSYRHTAEISQLDQSLLHPQAFLEFFLAQFGVFGPVMAAVLVMVAFQAMTLVKDDRLRFLAAFSLLPLGAFLGMSLLSRAFANWAAFSYVTGAALVSVWLIRQNKKRWLSVAIAINLALGAGLYHFHDIAKALNIQLTRHTDPAARVSGYRDLGKEVSTLLAKHPDARLLGDNRKSFASLLYYARPFSREAAYLNPSGTLNNHYALTADIKQHPGREFIFVTQASYSPEALKRWFESVESLGTISIPVLPDFALNYQVWHVRQFKGY